MLGSAYREKCERLKPVDCVENRAKGVGGVFRKKQVLRLVLKAEETKVFHKDVKGQLVQFHLIANKPIPGATHGTICLQGQQRVHARHM